MNAYWISGLMVAAWIVYVVVRIRRTLRHDRKHGIKVHAGAWKDGQPFLTVDVNGRRARIAILWGRGDGTMGVYFDEGGWVEPAAGAFSAADRAMIKEKLAPWAAGRRIERVEYGDEAFE